jgi:hypothetical protein
LERPEDFDPRCDRIASVQRKTNARSLPNAATYGQSGQAFVFSPSDSQQCPQEIPAMPKAPKKYAIPMMYDDAARVVAHAALVVQAEANRLHKVVEQLNQRPLKVFTQKERDARFYDLHRVPRVKGPSRTRKAAADQEAEA